MVPAPSKAPATNGWAESDPEGFDRPVGLGVFGEAVGEVEESPSRGEEVEMIEVRGSPTEGPGTETRPFGTLAAHPGGTIDIGTDVARAESPPAREIAADMTEAVSMAE